MTNSLTSFRMGGEGDRAPEFKASRDQLVVKVNGWLGEVATREDIEKQPLTSSATRMGRVRWKATVLAERRSGESMWRDGEGALHYERVSMEPDGVTTAVKIVGTDEFRTMMGLGYSSANSQEVVVAFREERSDNGGTLSERAYTVHGDGSVGVSELTHNGRHASQDILQPDGIRMAEEFFVSLTGQE